MGGRIAVWLGASLVSTLVSTLVAGQAAAAERVAARLGGDTEGGYGTLGSLALAEDGAWAGFDTGGTAFQILDTGTWSPLTATVCAGSKGAAVWTDSSGVYHFYTGCADGGVQEITVDASGDMTVVTPTLSTGSEPVVGVETDGEYVYAVYGSESAWSATAFAVEGGAVRDGWPVDLPASSVEDTAIGGGMLIVLEGGSLFSKVDLATGTASTTQGDVTYPRWVEGFVYEDSALFMADSGGTFGFVNLANTLYQNITYPGDVTEEVTAVGLGGATASGTTIVYSAFYASTATDLYRYAFSGGYATDQEQVIPLAGGLLEMAAITGGPLLGVNEDGELIVVTAAPWVRVGSVSPAQAVTGDTVAITFSADRDGTWELRRGGTMAADGALLAGGEASAGETISTQVEVTEAFAEGENRLWVFVTGTAGDSVGLVGHDAGVVDVDNPPGGIELSASAGEQSVSLQFAALPDEDIAQYDLYLTTVPFTADDWPSGGPAYEGPDRLAAAGVDTGPALPGGERVTHTFYPLTNGQTYYVAVRAVDEAGTEGPMSAVREVTPQPTFGAAQLAGEDGGFCAVSAAPGGSLAAGLLAGLAGLIAAVRRGRDRA